MSVPILPAATIVLTRGSSDHLEVFMLERNHDSGFVPGAHLFPGGAVDPDDAGARLTARSALPAGRAADLLDGEDALAHWVAAIRETFEEAGVLLARHADGRPVDLHDEAHRTRWVELRRAVDLGHRAFADVCEQEDLVLATDALAPFARWVTPEGAPRRYDTRFFVAEAPADQPPSHDGVEAIASCWVSPADALERHADGRWPMIEPTVRTLEALARFDTADEALSSIRAASEYGRPPVLHEHGGIRIRLPFDDPVVTP